MRRNIKRYLTVICLPWLQHMSHQQITYFKMTVPPFITGTKYYEHGMASSSPDMNIIENFWRKLKQGTKFKSSNDQETAIQVWESIRPSFIKDPYRNFPRRIQAVIKA